VAKETVQHVVRRHITNPKHVKTLDEGWEADVKEHVATFWQSGAHISEQKRSRQAVRQATGVLAKGWRGAGRRAAAEAMTQASSPSWSTFLGGPSKPLAPRGTLGVISPIPRGTLGVISPIPRGTLGASAQWG
jgi:hypothetical protein